MPTSVRRDATLSLSRGAKSLFIVFILQCFCAVKIIFILLPTQRVAQANTLRAHWVARVEQLAGQLIIKVAYHHFDAAGNQLECEGGGAYGFAINLYTAFGLCLNLYAMSLLEEYGRKVVDGAAVEVFEVFDYVPLGHIGYDGKIHKAIIHCGIWGLLEAAAVILSNSYRGGEDHTVIVLGAIYLYAELLRFELKEIVN